MPCMSLSLERCRELLGKTAENMTDDEIIATRTDMERMASLLYDQLRFEMTPGKQEIVEAGETEQQLRRDRLEAIRWIAYAHDTGEPE
jgi:predicted kinase